MHKGFIKRLTSLSGDNKRLVSNFFSLSVLQGLNYIFPIITMPYLVVVLGLERYGLLSVSTTFLTYFQLFTDYGFNLTATRDISIHRNDPDKVSKIYSTVMMTKVSLLGISFLIMLGVIYGIPTFREDSTVYLITFIGLIGNTIFPVWFYQGIENMKYITYFNVISRSVVTVLVFVIIKTKDDLEKVVLLNAGASLVIGIVSTWFVFRSFHVRFELPRVSAIVREIKDGFFIFLSTFSINMYIYSNSMILLFLWNKTVVGYYSVAERVIMALRSLTGVIFQSIYPQVCKRAKESHDSLKRFFKKIFIPIAGCALLGCLLVFLTSGHIVYLISQKQVVETTLILKILSFVPLIVIINIPAYMSLLAYNFKKSYTVILVSGSMVNIVLNLILAYRYQGYGTAVSVVLTEVYITAGLYIITELKHKKYSIFSSRGGSS